MFQRILLPYDGSERARQVIPIAARIAHAHNGVVLILQVTSPLAEGIWQMDTPLLMTQEGWQAEQESILAELEEVATGEELKGIPTETRVVERESSTAKMILEIARSWHADLIVLSSHGRTGFTRWVLGSIADTIVRQSPVPALILRVKGKSFPTRGNRSVRVLVGLDGSELAEEALLPAAQLSTALSTPFPGDVSLVRVLPLSLTYGDTHDGERQMMREGEEARLYLQDVEQRLAAHTQMVPEAHITPLLVSSLDIGEALVRVAEAGEEDRFSPSGGCDLIALATHRRNGLARWIIGSVAERVLHVSNLPLLIVPSPQEATHHLLKRRKHQLVTDRVVAV